jgi:hypothetical protein
MKEKCLQQRAITDFLLAARQNSNKLRLSFSKNVPSWSLCTQSFAIAEAFL